MFCDCDIAIEKFTIIRDKGFEIPLRLCHLV